MHAVGKDAAADTDDDLDRHCTMVVVAWMQQKLRKTHAAEMMLKETVMTSCPCCVMEVPRIVG